MSPADASPFGAARSRPPVGLWPITVTVTAAAPLVGMPPTPATVTSVSPVGTTPHGAPSQVPVPLVESAASAGVTGQ